MKRFFLILCLVCLTFHTVTAGFYINSHTKEPTWELNGKDLLRTPNEGLWGVSIDWKSNWMSDWIYAHPNKIENVGEWQVLTGEKEINGGKFLFRDSYHIDRPGLVHCKRRIEWKGKQKLERLNLSVRIRIPGKQMQVFMPGIIYYGNKNGANINSEIIPVYNGKKGEFAIFEEHRFPMPFVMIENSINKYAAALHSIPSPVRGTVLKDQWWSLGIETEKDYTDLVMYTGPIGYNSKYAVAKALQQKPMNYSETYITMNPGDIVEKEYYIELYSIPNEGSGFQRPVYTSIDLFKPFDFDKFSTFKQIIQDKYRFAEQRWITLGEKGIGFNMYDNSKTKKIVMGWCGQAASLGYALQLVQPFLKGKSVLHKVQNSLDFLSTFPVNHENGMFPVIYDGNSFSGGDYVSCGQAMYNFAKAIQIGRKNSNINTHNWETFLQAACDGQVKRILDKQWNPKSTSEAFFIAPLILSAQLFNNNMYKRAALKIANLYMKRHLHMKAGCYWGGTLDATCEDKEGAWAAFQGFLALYDYDHHPKYLTWAKHAMDICLSYTVVWDITFPPGRLADAHFNPIGWTVVSPQNQHLDVYGVLFAPEIYKMGQYLKDERLKKIARTMYRSCSQLIDIYGSQGEQVQHTNFAQRGRMDDVHNLRGGYAERWTVFWITAHFLNAAAKFCEMNVIP